MSGAPRKSTDTLHVYLIHNTKLQNTDHHSHSYFSDMSTSQDDIVIAPVETEQDIRQANYCVSEAFGRQAKDAVWILMNPGWDTKDGQAGHAEGMIKRWKSGTFNKDGQPNKIYLKATVPDTDNPGQRKVARSEEH